MADAPVPSLPQYRAKCIRIPIGRPMGDGGSSRTSTSIPLDDNGEPLGTPLKDGTFELSPQARALKAARDQGRAEPEGFRAMPNEPALARLELGGRVLAPPLPLKTLAALPDQSSMLNQCIDAMCANVDGFGFDFKYVGPEGQDESKEAKGELKRLYTMFKTVNPRVSLTTLRKRMRKDRESTGCGYWEVLRVENDAAVMFDHLPSQTMRQTKVDKDPIEIAIRLRGFEGEIVERTMTTRFRRFVQILDSGEKVYFKEFGDPRVISAKNGREVPENKRDAFPDDMQATEVLAFPLYSVQSPYGLPRHIGNMPAISGARQCDRVNERFFGKNAIPSMVVMVNGGHLTEDSFGEIKQYFQEGFSGEDKFWNVLVLEALPHERMLDDRGTTSIKLQPLQQERLTDATHQNYDRACMTKVRSSYRLPDIYTGNTEASNYATANASRQTVEEQVFQPERAEFDDTMNLQVLTAIEPPIRFWEFYSRGPEIADLATYVAAVTAFAAAGALTINATIQLANELLGTNIKRRDEPWADYPWAVVQPLVAAGSLKGIDEIMEKPDLGALLKAQGLQPPKKNGVQPPAGEKGTQSSEAGARAEGKPPVPTQDTQTDRAKQPASQKSEDDPASVEELLRQALTGIATLSLKVEALAAMRMPSAPPDGGGIVEALRLVGSGGGVRRRTGGLR